MTTALDVLRRLTVPKVVQQEIQGGLVTVKHGDRAPITDRYVGKTVAQVRAEVGATLQVPADAAAYLEGQELRPRDVITRPGTLEFVDPAPAKG